MTKSITISPLERYIRLEKLGEGNYGAVYKAIDTFIDDNDDAAPSNYCALKKLRLDGDDDGVPASALREVAICSAMASDHCVPLRGLVYDAAHLYLSYPLAHRDLRRYADAVGDLPPLVVRFFLYQILRGIEHAHSRRILHRDIKPQNILVQRNGTIQLADFGLARTYVAPIRAITHEVATLWYRPPEILLGALSYASSMDVWGIGCVFAEMSADMPLFAGDSEIVTLLKQFQLVGTPTPDVWADCAQLPLYSSRFPLWKRAALPVWKKRFPALDRCGIDLLQRLLHVDPSQRITARAALTHPYFDALDIPHAMLQTLKLSLKTDTNDGSERRRQRHATRA